MKKNKKLLILPLILVLLTANVQVQAETVLQKNKSSASVEKKELLPAVLADRAKIAADFVKREDLIAVLVHSLGIEPKEEEFSELPLLDKDLLSPDLKGYFTSAFKLGIFSGIPRDEGLFSDPLQTISKQEAATMIGKALGLRSTDATGFSDENEIASWALPYVSGLKHSALLWNFNNEFLPNNPLTWSELNACLQLASDSQKLIPIDIQVLAENNKKTEEEKRPDINKPMGITRDETGTLYIADSGNSTIASMDSLGNLNTYSGVASPKDIYQNAIGAYIDGNTLESAYSRPTDVYMTGEGLLIADTGNNCIRLLSKDTVFTYAGKKTADHLDGHRTKALFNAPSAICLDDKSNMYISDTLNHCIRKVDSKGMVTTIAGRAGLAGFQDGDALFAKLSQPRGLTFHDGALYIADSGNQRIRVYKDAKLTTLAGGGEEVYEGTDIIQGDYSDGIAEEARFNDPQGISFGKDSALYIADTGNAMIRKYQNGKVTTIAGVGLPINTLDNKVGNLLCEPVGILTLENELIVTDQFTNRILTIPLQ